VFENLFRNCIEHGSAGDRSATADEDDFLTITVGSIIGPDDDVCGFYVEDDGTGIAPEEREQVFEAGYSTGEGGTGFGLRIVRDIVRAHGWDIDCTAGAAGGARFEITGVDGR